MNPELTTSSTIYKSEMVEVIRRVDGRIKEAYCTAVNVKPAYVEQLAEMLFLRWAYYQGFGMRPRSEYVGRSLVTVDFHAAPRIPAASFDVSARVVDIDSFAAHCIAAVSQGFGIAPYVSISVLESGLVTVGLAASPYDAAVFIEGSVNRG